MSTGKQEPASLVAASDIHARHALTLSPSLRFSSRSLSGLSRLSLVTDCTVLEMVHCEWPVTASCPDHGLGCKRGMEPP